MSKKKLPVSIFEIVWYSICALVIIWGLTYVVLSLVDKYNDLSSLHAFATDFKKTFGLALYFWGLIIMAIGAVAGVVVMIAYAKTYDRAADREQRRSARLSALKKEDEKVVSEQQPEVVEEKPAEPAPVVEEKPAEEPKAEEAAEQPAEEPKAEEPAPEEAPAEEAASEEQPVEENKEETAE